MTAYCIVIVNRSRRISGPVWTATLESEHGQPMTASPGVGSSPAAALADLMGEARRDGLTKFTDAGPNIRPLPHDAPEDLLGIADVFRRWQRSGITAEAVHFAAARVWWASRGLSGAGLLAGENIAAAEAIEPAAVESADRLSRQAQVCAFLQVSLQQFDVDERLLEHIARGVVLLAAERPFSHLDLLTAGTEFTVRVLGGATEYRVVVTADSADFRVVGTDTMIGRGDVDVDTIRDVSRP